MALILECKKASQLESRSESEKWLIDGLIPANSVGIIGGQPKTNKSFLGLEVAIAVASGGKCLNRYESQITGPVLIFNGEDSQSVVRERLSGLASARNLNLDDLDIHVITASSLRLDLTDDVQALKDLIARLKPKLLI